jgi:hypothetical protein
MNRGWIRGNKGKRIKVRSFSGFVLNTPTLHYSSISYSDKLRNAADISITHSFDLHPMGCYKAQVVCLG